MNRPIFITDSAGRTLIPADTITEPNHGSVVLSDGAWGHAWQRHSDGLWYPVRGGKGRPWSYMIQRRSLALVYDAALRPEPRQRYEIHVTGAER
jgi:hypothetical protein